jgi:cytochrome c553
MRFPYSHFLLLPMVVMALPIHDAKSQDLPPEAYFRKHVEPILVKRCLRCHGSDRKGGLDLRSSTTALAGGESGVAIEPGKPDDSLLIEYIASGEMPPKQPLPKEEIAALEKWIRTGAWFPDRQLDPYALSSEHRAGYDWWSLQPFARPQPPVVKQTELVRHDIDRFVLAKLETHGLSFASPADRAAYIRRVTYDLTGLLPTYDEVQAFVGDQRPDAYETLVDHLLASPHYGQRWGRHWLDVVRFAESNGFERDRIRRNSWPYRDYVIRAFNDDKPYDQFIVEQIAGDALDPDNAEYRVATGFLAAGPKNDVDTISPLEKMQTRQDELDEFVVATGTTFLGLTVGCARCHDHKFDPIPARNYYSLTAVFSGCDHDASAVTASIDERRQHDQQVNN